MTESAQTVAGRLYPEIESYVSKREQEFEQISAERKSELQQLAVYVAQWIAKGQDAKLTFVCTHNSRRSHLTQIWTQIAAAHYGVNHVQTFSGGTEVTACNPRTVAALKRCGLRFSVLKDDGSNPHYSVAFSDREPPLVCYSKVFNKAPNPSSNYCAVMTCSHADQNCPVAIGCDLRLAIRYEDPKVSDDTPHEEATYDERCAQIAREMLYAISQVKS
jgi:arsenate reductase